MKTRLGAALLVLPLLAAAADARQGRRGAAAAPQVVSTSQITIDNGADFKAVTVPLTFTGGDWFASGGDAYASLTLESRTPPLRLDLQWTGAGTNHTIDGHNNTDMGGSQTFFFTGSGEGIYQLRTGFRGSDAVTITVVTLTDTDLEARLSGHVTGTFEGGHNPALAITGTIHLHRDTVPPRIATGSYGTCDNVVHDKFVGAESRSPSECEVKFDADVRAAFAKAFAGLSQVFPASGWTLKRPEPKPIVTQARGTERQPYRMDFASGGAYTITAEMTPANPAFAEYVKLGEPLRDPEKNRGMTVEEMTKALTRMQTETKARIVATVNMPIGSVGTFSAERTALTVPGAVLSFTAAKVQAPTGGGAGSAGPGAFIFAGSWSSPVIAKHNDGGEQIQVKSVFRAGAPNLAVQTVQIRISAGTELAKRIAGAIDLSPLTKLFPQ